MGNVEQIGMITGTNENKGGTPRGGHPPPLRYVLHGLQQISKMGW